MRASRLSETRIWGAARTLAFESVAWAVMKARIAPAESVPTKVNPIVESFAGSTPVLFPAIEAPGGVQAADAPLEDGRKTDAEIVRQAHRGNHPLDDDLPGNDVDALDCLLDDLVILRRGHDDDGVRDLVGDDLRALRDQVSPVEAPGIRWPQGASGRAQPPGCSAGPACPSRAGADVDGLRSRKDLLQQCGDLLGLAVLHGVDIDLGAPS